MFTKGLVIVFCLFFVFGSPISRSNLILYHNGTPIQGNGAPCAVPGQIVVKVIPGENENPWIARQLNRRYGPEIKALRRHPGTGYFVFEIPEDCDRDLLMESLRADPQISGVSLNYMARITVSAPSDPLFVFQYALHNEGQVYYPAENKSGFPGSDIKTLEGWDWSLGSPDVVIAILDTGVAADHEDLSGKMNPGYNFVDDSTDTRDDNGHGTFVASIAAAETDNFLGMAGVCRECRIMPIKAFDSEGLGDYLAIAAGIRFAVDQGARVLNLSFGGEYDSFILLDACRYAFESGCVLVAAAGNEATDILYPARYDSYCLAVGASDAYDKTAEWSNFGPEMDVAAPGDYVFGAVFLPEEPDKLNLYGWGSGTSFAAPYVAGAAALLISEKSFLTVEQVMNLIKYTADDVNDSRFPGVDIYMGYGRINLATLLGPYSFN